MLGNRVVQVVSPQSAVAAGGYNLEYPLLEP